MIRVQRGGTARSSTDDRLDAIEAKIDALAVVLWQAIEGDKPLEVDDHHEHAADSGAERDQNELL
jgi:hypothetical protein